MIHKDNHGFLSTKLLIILGLGVVLLVGGGFLAYLKFLKPAASASQAAQTEEKKAEAPADTPGPIFDMETFIVNLLDDSGRRYLKVTTKLELSSDLLVPEIQQKLPEIKDNIIVLLSSKSYEDIADISGKLRLRTEILSRLNKILTKGEVRKVFFTEFVIQ